VIVVDASAVVELLLQTELGREVEARVFRDRDELHAPHLLDVEVLQALRRIVHKNDIAPARAAQALDDLRALGIFRHAHGDLLGRAWALRKNVSAYDGVYIALAEALDASVVTCDGPLGAAPGHGARVEVISP
jgi:predicted nucleic acid-binding protein